MHEMDLVLSLHPAKESLRKMSIPSWSLKFYSKLPHLEISGSSGFSCDHEIAGEKTCRLLLHY